MHFQAQNKRQPTLSSAYCVPDTAVNALHILSHLTHIIAHKKTCFIDSETKVTETLNKLSKVTQLRSSETRI